MSGRDGASARDMALAAGAAASAALAFGVLLAGLATPRDFQTRLADLQGGIDVLQRAARPDRYGEILPAGAVCAEAAEGGPGLADSLRRTAAQAGLQSVRVQAAADPGPPPRSGLRLLRVRFDAEGGYDGAVQMLEVIGRQSPRVYADTVDLTAKGSGVVLSFSGRAFCAG